MSVQADKLDDRPVVYEGARTKIVCAITENGKSPAFEFLQNLDKSVARKFAVLFIKLGDMGRIVSTEQFKCEDNPIWAFKRDQYRISCFQDGKNWVLTHGFQKKKNKWDGEHFCRAKRIMSEDLNRLKKRQK